MKKNVLIIQRRLPRYRIAFFERLRDRLSERNIELSLVHGEPAQAEKARRDEGCLSWAWKVPCKYLKIGNTQAVWMSPPGEMIRNQDLVIIPHESGMLVNFRLLALRLALGKLRLAFWGHGKNYQADDSGEVRERFKRGTVPRVDWWFAYTQLSVKEVMAAGFSGKKITCVNNALDTASQRDMAAGISSDERQSLLKELGLKGEHCAVFLGSLYENKRLTFLFNAADELRLRIPDFELLVIGDGPQSAKVRDFVRQRPWTRWAGARFDREKILCASLGQIMLNPGLVGLNILDSFSLGVPIITTDCGIHSPEIAYLRPGENGLMTKNDVRSYVEAVSDIMRNGKMRERLTKACIEDAAKYTLDAMVGHFSDGIINALASIEKKEKRSSGIDAEQAKAPHVAVIWQRFLPYHYARLGRLKKALAEAGCRLTAIEVASSDASYGFPGENTRNLSDWLCCFPGTAYHEHKAGDVHAKVLGTLNKLRPDVVFAPATPFPEGMAAIAYRLLAGKRVVLMDDAWEGSDQRGIITKEAKRIIHENVDAAFIPALSHLPYYKSLNIPEVRIVYGVDVVDNDYFSQKADAFRADEQRCREKNRLPDNYFLFVGRFLPRKGIEILLEAYRRYREKTGPCSWELLLVGNGPHRRQIENLSDNVQGVHLPGLKFGDELCMYYALAKALIVPSERDPWALVVNEAMASGLPVIVSRGCGSALTLIKEGENGWTFKTGDIESLTDIMFKTSSLPPEALTKMGETSRQIISEWSLDRFVDGVRQAVEIPRRSPAGLFSNIGTRLWKGRVSVY